MTIYPLWKLTSNNYNSLLANFSSNVSRLGKISNTRSMLVNSNNILIWSLMEQRNNFEPAARTVLRDSTRE